MKRIGPRKHRFLAESVEGNWVWLEHGFPPAKTRTTHKGKPAAAPVKSRSGGLEPPAFPASPQFATVIIAPTQQFTTASPQQSTTSSRTSVTAAHRTYSSATS